MKNGGDRTEEAAFVERIDKQIRRTEQAVGGLYLEITRRFDDLEAEMRELRNDLRTEIRKGSRG